MDETDAHLDRHRSRRGRDQQIPLQGNTSVNMFLKRIDIFSNVAQVIESSGFGADKFTMVRNNDGTGSLKVVQPLDYEDKLQRNGFRFMIQVNDKV